MYSILGLSITKSFFISHALISHFSPLNRAHPMSFSWSTNFSLKVILQTVFVWFLNVTVIKFSNLIYDPASILARCLHVGHNCKDNCEYTFEEPKVVFKFGILSFYSIFPFSQGSNNGILCYVYLMRYSVDIVKAYNQIEKMVYLIEDV